MIAYLYYTLVALAFLCMYFAAVQFNKSVKILNEGTRTTAKVIDLLASRSDDGYTYKPVFEYVEHGQTIAFESSVSSNPPAYEIGEHVEIVYIAGTNHRKVIGYWSLYRWTIILLSLAAPMLIIGIGYILYQTS